MDELVNILRSLDSIILFACVLIFLLSLLLWFGRGTIGLTKNRVFDFVFLSSILAVIGSRIVYIILNNNYYLERIWGVYPYFLGEGDELVWFYDQPWVYFQLWDGGFHFLGVLIGIFVSILLFPVLFNLKRSGISLILLVLPLTLLLTRCFNLFTLLQGNELSFFFRGLSMVAVVAEIILSVILIVLIFFFIHRRYKYTWVSTPILFWIGMALSTMRYEYPSIVGPFNSFTLLIGVVLILYIAPSILYIRLPKLNRKYKDQKREKGGVPYSTQDNANTRKTYSLSFKDIDSPSSGGSNLSRKFYEFKRKILRVFKK